MPQLDFHDPLTLWQVFWMLVIFGVLYALVARWALPQVERVVDARAARIAADLDGARLAKMESDLAIAEMETAIRRASVEAQAQVNAALAEAKAKAAEQSRLAASRLDQQLADAERRIGEARAAALGALRDVATDTAASLIARLAGRPPDAGQVARAVDQVLAARA